MEPKRVAVYCRVSTLLDVQDSSFETQRDAYIQMIDSRNDLVQAYMATMVNQAHQSSVARNSSGCSATVRTGRSIS